MKTLSLAAFCALPLFAQSAHLSPREFPWRARIEVKESSGYAAVRINRGFYEKSAANFADLRLFGPSGIEVSSLLRDLHPAAPSASIATQTLDLVQTRKGQLQFILDFGVAPPFHNRLSFATTETDFRNTVLIESSLDRASWDAVRTAAILRFQQDGTRLESLSIDYPDSSRRYLRVTIDSWKDPKSLTAVTAQRSASPNAEDWEPLATAVPKAAPLPDRKSTRYDFAFPFGWMNDLRLSIESPAKEFYRSAELSWSSDGASWASTYGNVIYRVPGAEELSIRSRTINVSHLRLDVHDADSQPIEIRSISLHAPAREVVFPISGVGVYSIYLGLANAPKPSYDLVDILSRGATVSPIHIATPEWEPNPSYVLPAQRPKPFTERFPWLLPSVVVLAVAALGLAAYRLMKSAGQGKP
ncbi:MAG TPA: DUF3999 family protein [Bryobacteraceae bacterium]|nr:DUF3999 family protein [Bryobacteraceae bacterium]